jgi:hypothetical protein
VVLVADLQGRARSRILGLVEETAFESRTVVDENYLYYRIDIPHHLTESALGFSTSLSKSQGCKSSEDIEVRKRKKQKNTTKKKLDPDGGRGLGWAGGSGRGG